MVFSVAYWISVIVGQHSVRSKNQIQLDECNHNIQKEYPKTGDSISSAMNANCKYLFNVGFFIANSNEILLIPTQLILATHSIIATVTQIRIDANIVQSFKQQCEQKLNENWHTHKRRRTNWNVCHLKFSYFLLNISASQIIRLIHL